MYGSTCHAKPDHRTTRFERLEQRRSCSKNAPFGIALVCTGPAWESWSVTTTSQLSIIPPVGASHHRGLRLIYAYAQTVEPTPSKAEIRSEPHRDGGCKHWLRSSHEVSGDILISP